MYDNGVITKRTAQGWSAKFENDIGSSEDALSSGQPSGFNDLKLLLKKDRIPEKQLGSCPKRLVAATRSPLTATGLQKLAAWVPHEPSESDRQVRLNAAP